MFIAGHVSEIIGINNWRVSAGLMLMVGLLYYIFTRRFDDTNSDQNTLTAP
jgi:hypothetical protein